MSFGLASVLINYAFKALTHVNNRSSSYVAESTMGNRFSGRSAYAR
jgi:hypothetical protein